jgi:hypothetical protein
MNLTGLAQSARLSPVPKACIMGWYGRMSRVLQGFGFLQSPWKNQRSL